MELPERQDRASIASYLLYFYGPGVRMHDLRAGAGSLYSAGLDLWHVPVRPALGAQGPAPALPGLRVPGCSSGPGGSGLADFSRLEWHGDDVHGRTYAAPCSQPADKLVWRTAMAVPGHFVELSVCRVNAADSVTSLLRLTI